MGYAECCPLDLLSKGTGSEGKKSAETAGPEFSGREAIGIFSPAGQRAERFFLTGRQSTY